MTKRIIIILLIVLSTLAFYGCESRVEPILTYSAGPDSSVASDGHYVYIVDNDGIKRIEPRSGESERFVSDKSVSNITANARYVCWAASESIFCRSVESEEIWTVKNKLDSFEFFVYEDRLYCVPSQVYSDAWQIVYYATIGKDSELIPCIQTIEQKFDTEISSSKSILIKGCSFGDLTLWNCKYLGTPMYWATDLNGVYFCAKTSSPLIVLQSDQGIWTQGIEASNRFTLYKDSVAVSSCPIFMYDLYPIRIYVVDDGFITIGESHSGAPSKEDPSNYLWGEAVLSRFGGSNEVIYKAENDEWILGLFNRSLIILKRDGIYSYDIDDKTINKRFEFRLSDNSEYSALLIDGICVIINKNNPDDILVASLS